MIPQLLDALEKQADKGLLQLLDARARVRVLEARNRELQAHNHDLQARNEALQQQLDTLKEEARHPQVTAGRSQGLAALMARRPRHHAAHNHTRDAHETHDADDTHKESAPASGKQVAPKPVDGAALNDKQPAPEASVDTGPQGRLSIDEAPSPQALLDQWYRHYTDTFFKGHTRPLKVGIHEDLMTREPWPEKLVRRALACYVHLPRYLKAVRAGTERVGLDGGSAGTVTEGEAKYAKKQLDDLQAQNRTRQAKRREKQQQQEKDARLEQKLSELLAKHDR